MQAARHGLRHGGSRDALPGPGHARRLRRALPSYNRGCYGCFGPMETPNTGALTRKLEELGMGEKAIDRVYRTFNVRHFEEARGK